MTLPRIIPVVQIYRTDAIKTLRFKNKFYIGDPVNSVRLFSDMCADELIVIDVGAARGEYPPQVELLSRMAAESFMPFGYGGGVRNTNDAAQVFDLGAEKVIVRWRGLETQSLVRSLAQIWGHQAVSVVVDYFDRNKSPVRNKNTVSRRKVLDIVRQVEQSGAGEVVLQSVDRDGSMSGLDVALIREVSPLIKIQLVVVGGAQSTQDLGYALAAGASAVAAGSLFLFCDRSRSVLINYPTEKQLTSISNLNIEAY